MKNGQKPKKINGFAQWKRAEKWRERCEELRDELELIKSARAQVDNPIYQLGWRDGYRSGRNSRW